MQQNSTNTSPPSPDEVKRMVVAPAIRLLTRGSIVHKAANVLVKNLEIKNNALLEDKIKEMMLDYAVEQISGDGDSTTIREESLSELKESNAGQRLREKILNIMDDRILVYKIAHKPSVISEIDKTMKEKESANLVTDDEAPSLREALVQSAIISAEMIALPRSRHNVNAEYEDIMSQYIRGVGASEVLQSIDALVGQEWKAMQVSARGRAD